MKNAAVNGLSKANDIGRYTSLEYLRDGRSITIRAIRPDDRGLLVDTLNQLSPKSLYLRLFSGKRTFSDEEWKWITTVDFVNVVALVAVLEREGIDHIVGGGRYVRLEPAGTAQRAEVAFLIDDAYQGLGIGSRLFRHLVAIARQSKITQFEAEVLPSNAPMLRLFAGSSLPVTTNMQGDTVHITIQLTPP